jgi:dolichol-phosphate mannosyltransferase
VGEHELRYSVVVPLHDEAEALPVLARRLTDVLEGLAASWEVILVDDGSRDDTYRISVDFHRRDPRFKVVRLTRNFGHQIALSAGLRFASGDAIVTMDGDLQHPPEMIPKFVDAWKAGNDVVYGVMTERRGETYFKKVTARLFYRVIAHLSDLDLPAAAGDFRLISRHALTTLNDMPERRRYLRGMFSWMGFQEVAVPYTSGERAAGSSKYTTARMVRLAVDAIISFSDRPLRLALNTGFVVALLSLCFGAFSVFSNLLGVSVPGWTSIIVLIGVVGGIQLMVIGVVGEYVGAIYDEVKRRPLYLVAELHGLRE